MIAQTKFLSGKKENITSLRHIDSEEMTHQLFLRNLYFRIVVRKKIKLYQSSLFVIYPNCTKPIKLHLNESFLKKFTKKDKFILRLKNTQPETIRIAQNDIKMFTKKFKNMLFLVVCVAHEISYDYFFLTRGVNC